MFKRIISYFKKDKSSCLESLISIGDNKSKRDLIKLAYTDIMTGCYNRNVLEEYRETFDTMELYVGIVDIDGLKMLNDVKGHHAGDTLIKTVANSLKTLDAFVIRLGGDEFIVLSTKHVLYSIGNASYGVVYKSKDTLLSHSMKRADNIMYYDKKRKNHIR